MSESKQEVDGADVRLAQRIAGVGFWSLDPEVGVPEWSGEIYRIYERDPELGPYPFDEYRNIYSGEWFDRFDTAIRAAIDDGIPYDIELKLILPSGREKWIRALCEPDQEVGPKGRKLRGTILDMTEKKLTDEKLKTIEWMLTKEPTVSGTHGQGYGDLTTLNRDGLILQSVGKDTLSSLCSDFLRLLETSAAVYEKNGDYAYGIFSSGWCRLLDGASRALCGTDDNSTALTTSGKWLCHESCWTDCSRRAIDSQAPVDIQCRGGIHVYSVPVFAEGDVIGAINFGYGDPPTDADTLQSLADAYGVDPEELARAADAYKSRPAFIVELAKQQLLSSARLIGAIVEGKCAEAALRESEDFLNRTGEMALVGGWQVDLDTNRVLWTQTTGRIHELPDGYSPDLEEAISYYHPMDQQHVRQCVQRAVEEGEPFDFTVRLITAKGRERWVQALGQPVFDAGRCVRLSGTFQDITQAKQTEQAREASEARYARLAANIPGVAFQNLQHSDDPPDDEFPYISPGIRDLFGLTPKEVMNDSSTVWGAIHPEDVSELTDSIRHAMETGADWNHDFRISTTEKETKWVRGMASHERQPDGSIFWDGLLLDITEQKQADERLRQMAKMECVGRLAGGVAHDYNNIIMGILNYAEFCRDCIDADHPIRQWVDEITTEAQRSANLTRQLLAFARKQTITPKVLDLNDAVVGMLRMLQRLIGEDIELVWEPGANVWQVTMDPSQVDQILANLCVNARDAIGGVGRITIETDNVELDADDCANYAETVPGAYVVLTVSDTGCGMDRQTLEHVFEPFFTTKSVGEGTGLGLATVYGITKQSNGHLSVDSEPGQGTTFRIYLPRAAEDSPGMEREPPEATTPGGNETILLVEDEKSIRVTAGMFLRAVGYTVLAAENPEQALRLATEHEGPIHLLITDVVMPDMSGRDLADRLTEDSPDISVIYMSGYTADVIAHRGVLEAGVDFLSKPFTRDVLTLKVREVLDRA